MLSMFGKRACVADAEALARNLGIRLEVIPITGVYDSYQQQPGRYRPAAPLMTPPRKTSRPASAATC